MFVREDSQKKYSTISITYEDGSIESYPLGNTLYANLEDNNKAIAKALNNIGGKGYDLVGITGGDFRARYVFKKK